MRRRIPPSGRNFAGLHARNFTRSCPSCGRCSAEKNFRASEASFSQAPEIHHRLRTDPRCAARPRDLSRDSARRGAVSTPPGILITSDRNVHPVLSFARSRVRGETQSRKNTGVAGTLRGPRFPAPRRRHPPPPLFGFEFPVDEKTGRLADGARTRDLEF